MTLKLHMHRRACRNSDRESTMTTIALTMMTTTTQLYAYYRKSAFHVHLHEIDIISDEISIRRHIP